MTCIIECKGLTDPLLDLAEEIKEIEDQMTKTHWGKFIFPPRVG